MFQRRHYELIARALHETKPNQKAEGAIGQWKWDISKLCDMFEANNARFDRARFRAACGDT